MKSEKIKEPETEYGKLTDMLRAYEKILHPDFFNPIIYQVGRVYAEAKAEAYRDANISPEALEVEKIILDIKEKADHNRLLFSFHMKYAYKQILQIFKNAIDEKERTDPKTAGNSW